MSSGAASMDTAHSNLKAARKNKNDEFYTQFDDIAAELRFYKHHFKDKVVYCNCDDPRMSNFFEYFSCKFKTLGLRRLIASCYKNRDADLFSRHDSEQAVYLEYTGKEGNAKPGREHIAVKALKGDGDFRSAESIALLQQADVVVTNPPFSLFREYVAQLVEHDKKFVILGNKNAVTYKEIFKLIKENRLWIGNTPMGADLLFDVPEEYAQELLSRKESGSSYKVVNGVVKGRSQAVWFTNLDTPKRHKDLELYRRYKPEAYPHYDNYNAINVDKTKDIPDDYAGVMGVPISFLDKYNPDQFEIIWTTDRGGDGMLETIKLPHSRYDAPVVKGKGVYKRILIRNRRL